MAKRWMASDWAKGSRLEPASASTPLPAGASSPGAAREGTVPFGDPVRLFIVTPWRSRAARAAVNTALDDEDAYPDTNSECKAQGDPRRWRNGSGRLWPAIRRDGHADAGTTAPRSSASMRPGAKCGGAHDVRRQLSPIPHQRVGPTQRPSFWRGRRGINEEPQTVVKQCPRPGTSASGHFRGKPYLVKSWRAHESMGWLMGFEPTTTGITIRDSTS